jgi:hypothetical protein
MKLERIMNALLDGFHDAPEVESPRLIQGELVKFSNEVTWVTRGGEELPCTIELVAVNVTRVVRKWADGRPIESRALQPGEKLPSLDELNANEPQSAWREGPDGKLHGPWQAEYLVYLLNPDTAERFSFATGTIGGGIAVRDLIDRVSLMRKVRGEQVYAVISPSAAPMKTRYGTRPRPQFVVSQLARPRSPATPAINQAFNFFRQPTQDAAARLRPRTENQERDMREQYFKIETFGKPRDLQIADVHKKHFKRNGRAEPNYVMTFNQTNAMWIVSTTAFLSLCDEFGTDETASWVDAWIRLRVDHDAKFDDEPAQFRARVLSDSDDSEVELG